MTDNEIIKALECCSSENGKDDCLTCPNFKDFADCKEDLSAIALDLINRLQERIKKLENIERFATKTIEKQEKEIEKQQYILMGVMHSVDKWLDGDELKQDEVNRAATMREKTLQITEKQQAEIERLQSEKAKLHKLIPKMIKDAKSEAIKEFAERLCEGRVSNAPVVIAVKAELKLTEVKNNE